MKVFISWSGETSQKIARILRDWLPTVIYGIEPWVSSEDIQKGTRWGLELFKQLDKMQFGIICIDHTNLNSPWLNFEAGALSKSLENSKVFPILFGISPSDLNGPIAQFQVTCFEKEDFYKLIRNLDQTLQTSNIPPERLLRSFETAWPGLVSAINSIHPSLPKNNPRANTLVLGRKENQIVKGFLNSVNFKIFYIDALSKQALNIQETMTKAGCKVKLVRLTWGNNSKRTADWNGYLFYRNSDVFVAALEARSLIDSFVREVEMGAWAEKGDDLVLWLSSE